MSSYYEDLLKQKGIKLGMGERYARQADRVNFKKLHKTNRKRIRLVKEKQA